MDMNEESNNNEKSYYRYKKINLAIVIACLIFMSYYLIHNIEIFKNDPLPYLESKLGGNFTCTCTDGQMTYGSHGYSVYNQSVSKIEMPNLNSLIVNQTGG